MSETLEGDYLDGKDAKQYAIHMIVEATRLLPQARKECTKFRLNLVRKKLSKAIYIIEMKCEECK